jgi:tight adherence protein C
MLLAGVFSLLLFVMLLSVVAYVGHRYYARPGRIMEQVGSPTLAFDLPARSDTAGPGGAIIRTLRTIGEKVPVSPQEASMARRYLIAAGFRSETALVTYYGLKVVLGVVLVVLAILIRESVSSMAVLKIPFICGAALAGFFGPNLVLERLVGRRQERLRFSLPDALDMMVVSVEAGLGLDQAMQAVSRELVLAHKDLCEELGLVTLEMRAGKRRADALRNLAARTGQQDIRQLVAILIQADRFGTSMAESLRTHSDFLRVRRRQEAEERANKIGVKLVFPIFFCILPSMFIVAGGPAVLQVLKFLLPMLRHAAV